MNRARTLQDGRLQCRTCQDLGYPSQHRPKLQRLHDKARDLRAKLRRWSDFSEEFPPRPKGMHLLTYNTLLMEIVQTEAQIVELQQQKINQSMSRALGYQCSPGVSLAEHWEHVLGA